MTSEHEGLLLSISRNAEPMVPDEPITRALKELGSKFIKV